MDKNLTELQSRNDSLWLDAICDEQYYSGKHNAHIIIDGMIWVDYDIIGTREED